MADQQENPIALTHTQRLHRMLAMLEEKKQQAHGARIAEMQKNLDQFVVLCQRTHPRMKKPTVHALKVLSNFAVQVSLSLDWYSKDYREYEGFSTDEVVAPAPDHYISYCTDPEYMTYELNKQAQNHPGKYIIIVVARSDVKEEFQRFLPPAN